MSNEIHKPIIAFTVGDINGVGPELIMNAFSNEKLLSMCTPVIYGSGRLFSFYRKALQFNEFNYKQIKSVEDVDVRKINLVSCWEEELKINPGESTSDGGKASFLSLKAATKDWVEGRVDALVTCPINKSNIQNDEFKFAGHTEYLTKEAGASDSLMLMTSPRLKMGVVTSHIPLGQVAQSITQELIVNKVIILNKTLINDFGISKPKIAVLGLNPHAGDNGLLGKEEQKIIMPALDKLKRKNVLAFGPFSGDGFFGAAQYQAYDGVLAMYHDQGLIPFKTIAFEEGVNYTAGLKLIRTSPDHGTAYEIAGKGTVNIQSFLESIYTIIDIVKNRKEVLIPAAKE
jgi:4-hydroxythreonine-4-phosphate dehydrogenase